MPVSPGASAPAGSVDLGSHGALRFAPAEDRGTSRAARVGRSGSPVIDLAGARDARRLADYQARSRAVLDTNKRALRELFHSGLIYSRTGARLGRDLLLARQHLLRVADLLAQLGERPARRGRGEALCAEVQDLLARTSALTARSDVLLARQR